MTDLKMHDVAKAAWCDALAEPGLLQTTGKLYGEQPSSMGGAGLGYCCLGVFAKCQGATLEFEMERVTDEEGTMREELSEDATVAWTGPSGEAQDLNSSELLDQDWADTFGLTAAHQAFLSTLNDGGEATITKADPFFLLYQRYCETESAPRFGLEDDHKRLFSFRKHSFAEIRNVILIEF